MNKPLPVSDDFRKAENLHSMAHTATEMEIETENVTSQNGNLTWQSTSPTTLLKVVLSAKLTCTFQPSGVPTKEDFLDKILSKLRRFSPNRSMQPTANRAQLIAKPKATLIRVGTVLYKSIFALSEH